MQNKPDFWLIVYELWRFFVKWFPTIAIGIISSWISVQFQIHRKKVNTVKQAWGIGVMAFLLSMLVNYVASLRFEPWIANAMGIGTAIYGRDLLLWFFSNWDGILRGIFGFFKVKIPKKKGEQD
jgi:hypothetical protein